MSTTTKKDLIREVSDKTGVDIASVKEIIQCMFDTMCEGLAKDGNIEIRNFGIFRVKHTGPRKARNPKNKTEIIVPAKKHIHFKPGKTMKARINQKIKPSQTPFSAVTSSQEWESPETETKSPLFSERSEVDNR